MPSPRIEIKFKSQSEHPVLGNDFIYHLFGHNAEWRHRHFKIFLAIPHPGIVIPIKKKYHNWKVRPLLQWMNFLFPLMWVLRVCFAIDNMTIVFQGMHTDEKRITYKVEGGTFQRDALCDNGFCCQYYFCNEPANMDYMKTGLSRNILELCHCLIPWRITFMFAGWIIFTILQCFARGYGITNGM